MPKLYSQNGEDIAIKRWLKGKDFVKRFLDIGANDGITLSNTYLFYKDGWRGTYVEPDTRAMNKLIGNVDARNTFIPYAIGDKNGEVTFWQGGDGHAKHAQSMGLLSTTKQKELKRWGSTETFSKTTVEMRTLASSGILDHGPYTLINIDAEGQDYNILSQMDLTAMGCKVLVIEYNNISEVKENILWHCANHNMYMLPGFSSFENLILVK